MEYEITDPSRQTSYDGPLKVYALLIKCPTSTIKAQKPRNPSILVSNVFFIMLSHRAFTVPITTAKKDAQVVIRKHMGQKHVIPILEYGIPTFWILSLYVCTDSNKKLLSTKKSD